MPALHAVEISADVLVRARSGDRDAHTCLYQTLSKPVYTLLRRFVVRPAIAEELLQDVFVEILRNLNSYSGAGPFAGWVRRIAVNKALMYLRSPWHRSLSWLGADSTESIHEPGSSAMPAAFDSDLERALAALPPVTRAVVWLHDVEELTHSEIAQLFGRTVSFSKSQLARAHSALRDRLETPAGGLACMPISRNC